MLLESMQNMTASELGDIKWLVINQNDGINKDDLVSIMALLVNLERLSLNSNNMWYVSSSSRKLPILNFSPGSLTRILSTCTPCSSRFLSTTTTSFA